MTDIIETTGEVIDTVDRLATPTSAANIVVKPGTEEQLSRVGLANLGFIMPIAEPAVLREAFAMQQAIYAAILGPTDYIYTVTFKTGNKPLLTRDHAYAKKMAEDHDGIVSANPMKTGVTKLARALGITATRTRTKGLPEEHAAKYAYVEYEAKHIATGLSEIGIGYCDFVERNKAHDVIATADTRAYTRAVLRLAGFGNVSADEVIAGASDGSDLPQYVPDPRGMRDAGPLPPIDDINVVAAASAWAETMGARQGKQQPEAQQGSQAARELRARARRGDTDAGRQLGAQGLRWHGVGQDAVGIEPFEVEASPVEPRRRAEPVVDQAQREQEAMDRVAHAGDGGGGANGGGANGGGGWDLSSKGSVADDAAPGTETGLGIPVGDPKHEVITTKQAKNLSAVVMALHNNDKEAALHWVRINCHVARTTDMRANQYEKAMAVAEAALEEKNKKETK